jgi:hypothetical protein
VKRRWSPFLQEQGCALKGLYHELKFFWWKASEKNRHFRYRVPMVFNFLGFLVEKKNNFKILLGFITLLSDFTEKIVPEVASEFLFRLSLSAIG